MDTAKKCADAIFDGTRNIEDAMNEMKEIAYALHTLGIPAGNELLSLIHDCKKQSSSVRHAYAEYVGAQANGTLYKEIT